MKLRTILRTRPFFLLAMATMMAFPLQAQKKKELLVQIDTLKMRLRSTESMLQQSRKNEAALSAKVMEYEKQLESSRATNASLLETLTRITEESKNHTESVGQALTELRRKEGQLRSISDALTRADSTTIKLLTALKQAMGQNTNIGLETNVLTLSMKDADLFDGPSGKQLVGVGKGKLMKLAEVIRKAPGAVLEIQSYQGATAEEEERAAIRALAISRYLVEEGDVPRERLLSVSQPMATDSVVQPLTNFRIRPNFEAFFTKVKSDMKQSRGF